jgi:uncharacterized membrane protein
VKSLSAQSSSTELRAPGLLLGAGLGGLVDGIVLHQILQWHHMLSSTGDHPVTSVRGLEANTLWDGLFHAAAWLLVTAGLIALWRVTARRRARGGGSALTGSILVGWGVFNLVEGVVNHHVLGIHHVRAGSNELVYDLLFLAAGIVLVAGGIVLYRRASEHAA